MAATYKEKVLKTCKPFHREGYYYATEFICNETISRQKAGTRQFCMNNEELAQEQRLLWHMPDEY